MAVRALFHPPTITSMMSLNKTINDDNDDDGDDDIYTRKPPTHHMLMSVYVRN